MSHPNLPPTQSNFPAPQPWSNCAPLHLPEDAAEAVLTFTLPDGNKPVIEMAPPGGGEPQRNATYVTHKVKIHDGRQLVPGARLDQEGFELIGHRSDVLDFYDKSEVQERYYPETERLIKQLTGATEVLAFDHNTRCRRRRKPYQ